MTIEQQLMALLSRDGIQSGTDIGAVLGISRVAVKKRISNLVEQGFPVKAVAGRGYELEEGVELLSKQRILAKMPDSTKNLVGSLDIHKELPSTNAYLRQSFNPQKDSAQVIIAESQPQGKGRRGRGWVATPFRNLMMSVGWRYAEWPRNPSALSLAFAVAVHQSLCASGADQIDIKWPNDILLGGKKIAGLLVDATGEASGGCDLVFGVGINFLILDEDADQIDQPWSHLSAVKSVDPSRNNMAASVISNLLEALVLYQQDGFAPFASYWNEHAAFVGEKVRLFNADEEYQGELLGVNDNGELELRSDSGEKHSFVQADVSMRLLS